MGASVLEWVIKIPIPSCPKCGKESVETVGRLIDRDEVSCPNCGNMISLTSKEWSAYLKKAKDAIAELRPLYSKLD